MPTIQLFHDAVLNLQPINLLEYVDIIPEFKVMNDCEHENIHHLEGSILVHANMASAEVLKLLDQVPEQNNKVALYLSTILHDIGKPNTKIYKEAKQKHVYYGHDKAGVPLAKDFGFDAYWAGDRAKFGDLPSTQYDLIEDLIDSGWARELENE